MKKILITIMFIVAGVFAEFDADSVFSLLDSNPSVTMFKMKTKWRVDFSSENMSGETYPNFSKMSWMLDRENGYGLMVDETESITSIYYVTSIDWNTLNGSVIATMWIESNVGNNYVCVVNELNHTLIMTGDMDHIVIRRFYDVE